MAKKNTPDTKDYSIKEIKKMLIADSAELEYGRVNITLPKTIISKIENKYPNTPRSRVVANLVMADLERIEKEEKWVEIEKVLNKRRSADYSTDDGSERNPYERKRLLKNTAGAWKNTVLDDDAVWNVATRKKSRSQSIII